MRKANGRATAELKDLTSSMSFSKTFRFVASAAVNADINVFHIRNLLGMGSHTALPSNGVYYLIDSFRIKSVRMYFVDSQSSVPQTVSLDWISTPYGKSNKASATSLGVVPADLRALPPADSAATFWRGGTDAALFRMVCPTNTIVELALDLILYDGLGVFAGTTAVVTDAAVYCKHLDSTLGSSTGNLVPQGWTNVLTS